MESVCARLPFSLSKCTLKRYFFDIYLTTFFGVRNFGNTLAMSFIFFFSTCSKFPPHFKTSGKDWEKVFCFFDNCVSIGSVKLCLLRREHLSSVVNVLTNSFKILNITKRELIQLPLQWSMNMVKVSSFRFQQCWGVFTMLLVEAYCEAALFRHFSNVFRSP